MSCDWIMTGYLHSTSLYDVFFFLLCVSVCVYEDSHCNKNDHLYTPHQESCHHAPKNPLALGYFCPDHFLLGSRNLVASRPSMQGHRNNDA